MFTKIIGHVGHFRWLGPNVWWEISQFWIEYIEPITQMSDEPWKFSGNTVFIWALSCSMAAWRYCRVVDPNFNGPRNVNLHTYTACVQQIFKTASKFKQHFDSAQNRGMMSTSCHRNIDTGNWVAQISTKSFKLGAICFRLLIRALA